MSADLLEVLSPRHNVVQKNVLSQLWTDMVNIDLVDTAPRRMNIYFMIIYSFIIVLLLNKQRLGMAVAKWLFNVIEV